MNNEKMTLGKWVDSDPEKRKAIIRTKIEEMFNEMKGKEIAGYMIVFSESVNGELKTLADFSGIIDTRHLLDFLIHLKMITQIEIPL